MDPHWRDRASQKSVNPAGNDAEVSHRPPSEFTSRNAASGASQSR